MNKLSLSSLSGKFFWGSLIGYCLAFVGFYLITQHAHDRIVYEEQQGIFSHFKESICENGICSELEYENAYSVVTKEYKTLIDIKSTSAIDEMLLQQKYKKLMSDLPWYVRMQFNDELEIRSVNGKKVVIHE